MTRGCACFLSYSWTTSVEKRSVLKLVVCGLSDHRFVPPPHIKGGVFYPWNKLGGATVLGWYWSNVTNKYWISGFFSLSLDSAASIIQITLASIPYFWFRYAKTARCPPAGGQCRLFSITTLYLSKPLNPFYYCRNFFGHFKVTLRQRRV
jgi:hypothetical protein